MTAENRTKSNLNEQLVSQLRELSRRGGDVNVSQFEFIGFDVIASAYGDEWAAHQDRVKETAEAFLKRRVGEKDLLVRGADGFLIVFADADKDRTRTHAEALKDDLNAFYLGEGATQPPVEVEVSHRQLPAEDLIKSFGDLNIVEPPAAAASKAGLADVDWRYQPVWDARREAIFSYYIAPVLKENGRRVPGYQFDVDFERDVDFVAIDEMALKKSEQTLEKMIQAGQRCQLGVSIHSSSLMEVTDRNRLLSIMKQFDRRYLGYRMIQIAATPPGMPRIYLDEIYAAMKRCTPRVAISLAWNESDLRSIIQMKPAAIGFTLSPWALDIEASVTRSELLAKARQAAGAARDAKIPFYFDGSVSADLVAKLREAGVDVISSPDVWPMADFPQAAHLWPSNRLAA